MGRIHKKLCDWCAEETRPETRKIVKMGTGQYTFCSLKCQTEYKYFLEKMGDD